ncbi:MAG TPA: ComEC/Rec2 family competence protein [Pseudochrobactrum sp.]|nr:ComEC/Rec2 family competence protein [Pseudochrobactrum sp.]
MTNGSNDEYRHQRRDTESRPDHGGTEIAAIRLAGRAGLSPEQVMLGLQQDLVAETAPANTAFTAEVESALPVRLSLREHWQNTCENIRNALLLEYERGTVFLLFAVAAGTGAVHYFALTAEPYWAELAVPAFLFGWLWFLLRDTLVRRVGLILILAFVAGMATAKWETQRYATQMLGSSVSTVLTARIVSLEQEADSNGKAGRWRIIADVLATEKPHLRYAPQRLRLSARDLPAMTETGSVIKGAVRLRPHGGPVRSGQYDFAFHGYFRGVGGNGFYLGIPKIADALPANLTEGRHWSAHIAAAVGQLRAIIGGRIMQALPEEEGAIAAALISGQRAGISEDTNEALRIAGLAHILSISGLHLALAAGIVMVSVRGFAGLFPSLSLYYPVKKIAALISLFSSGFYLALSGADVAAQRSFIMLAVMLCAVILDRQALTMRNLAIAALFSIVLTPHEILGPSFQMSYSATGALIAGFAWVKLRKRRKEAKAERHTGLGNKIRQFLIGIVATSLLAGTASGLYAAFHFNNMAPLGMLGNALALPVISLLIMPFAVITLLLMPIGLEWLPLQVMGKGIELVKWIAHYVAGLSPDLIPGLLPAPVMLLWTLAMLSALILTSHLRAVSLVFLGAGGIALMAAPLPDIIISEDAKLVAIRQNNIIYVNRERPSAFTIENWRKAYGVTEIRTPETFTTENPEGFICEDGLCSYDFADGRVLAHAESAQATEIACAIGDIVISAYASDVLCGATRETGDAGIATAPQPLVVSRQQLALKGVAEIYLASREQSAKPASIVHAIGEPQRPWHLYRLYSRAARNLAERN